MDDPKLMTLLKMHFGLDEYKGHALNHNEDLWKKIKKEYTYDTIIEAEKSLGILPSNDLRVEKSSSKRRPHDFYATPITVVEHIIDELLKDDLLKYYINKPVIRVLDPFAGGDANKGYPMPFPHCLKAKSSQLPYEFDIVTVDIREDSPADYAGTDFFTMDKPANPFDLCLTNPPFTEFTRAASLLLGSTDYIARCGVVGFLGRLSILASKSRRDWFKEHMLHKVYVLSERPSFTGDGGVDVYDYAFFVWVNSDIFLHSIQADLRII